MIERKKKKKKEEAAGQVARQAAILTVTMDGLAPLTRPCVEGAREVKGGPPPSLQGRSCNRLKRNPVLPGGPLSNSGGFPWLEFDVGKFYCLLEYLADCYGVPCVSVIKAY